MTTFDTLGSFYLGKHFDLTARARRDDLLLYDAKDLTTHAVIIGMTGSGKTGLGIGLLEEALIDRVPVIAVDPKGDLGNLALRFPLLRGTDFEPWVDPQQATTAGLTPAAFAEQQADLWRSGLATWQQDGARVQRFADAAAVTIYTPGSSAGIPLSLLRAFEAPPAIIRDDAEALQERVDATATSVLALLGIDADPISSREQTLLATLLHTHWLAGESLDLAGLIRGVQTPPFDTVGVMPLETVFPAKERMALALQLNNLLASPGFQRWMQGDALDTASLLFDPAGRPRGSVLSIAHLSESERMFFMTLLLADVLTWVRAQPGTGTLRAILYIDELFGYMPPVANPPSKRLLLTLLKQARAYGLGVVLATQNPVDLDYRGLSNTGTWFIGRLQTERDKQRVMEGLEGAAGGQTFDRGAMEQTIAGLGKRVFLMHSVHEPAPVTFETRWTLSYLAGPMTREQLRTWRAGIDGAETSAATPTATAGLSPSAPLAVPASSGATAVAPVLAPEIPQFFLPPAGEGSVEYTPVLFGVADLHFSSAKHGVEEQRRVMVIAPVSDGPIALDWASAERVVLDLDRLERSPRAGATFVSAPPVMTRPKSYPSWSKALQKWLAANDTVTLFRSAALKTTSVPGESARDFRIRLQLLAHEQRDVAVEALRTKYATRLATMQERVRKAEQAVEREQTQATQAKVDSAISMGGAILGAFFGRGRISAGTVGRVGSAARGAGRAAQQAGDVVRANETLEAAVAQYQALEARIQLEIDALGSAYDAASDPLDEIIVKAKQSDVTVHMMALLWRVNSAK